MAIKLIVTDLDGTLLTDKQEISPRTVAAMQAAKARGIRVTVATGRMHLAAAYFARQIGADVPVISCNGGLVRGLEDDHTIFANCYAKETANEVIAECYRQGWYAQWYVDGRVYAKEFRPEMFAGYRNVTGFKVHEVGDDFERYMDRVIQIVIRDQVEGIAGILDTLCAKFGDRIEQKQNTKYSVDLTPPGIHKAVGLEHLISFLGIRPEEVIAFGDAENDVEMLRCVGTSVATQNALDAVKEIADHVTDDCNHDGVAKAIEAYVLKE